MPLLIVAAEARIRKGPRRNSFKIDAATLVRKKKLSGTQRLRSAANDNAINSA